MHRRDFLRLSGAGCLGLAGVAVPEAPPLFEGQIVTVRGAVAPKSFGSALCHEHVLVDFVGAERISRARYDANEAYDVALPYLRAARALGCRAFVECTPAYLGRDPRLLERLAAATDLHIITNTGYYGAANDRYVPKHAYEESADHLADRWVREWQDGIEGTGIRPGFIKTGVDAGPLSDIDRKLIQAAARTHARTGLPIASHTGDTRAALEQLDVLAAEGAPASAFVWVHAQNDWALEPRVQAAAKGAWIELDNVADDTVGANVERATAMKARGQLGRLLVSHDAGWYRPGEPRGGRFRGFETVYTALVPALRRAGWTMEDISRLLEVNPAAAFTIRPPNPRRRLEGQPGGTARPIVGW